MMTPQDNSTYQTITEQYGRLVSYSLPCPDVTLVTFLHHTSGQERIYWENANTDLAFAGMGVAVELTAWGEDRFHTIQRRAQELFDSAVILGGEKSFAAPRLFGGFSFRDDFVPDNTWTVLHPAHFVLPHYQLVQRSDETWLTINAHLPLDEDPQALLPELHEALTTRIELLQMIEDMPTINQSRLTDVTYPMSYETWYQTITNAIQQINTGELNKVVLSRVCEICFEERVNVDEALAFLADQYAECYRFLFEPRAYHAFYGATPELLAEVSSNQVTTMGLAGSIRRGKTPDEDMALAEQMKNDPKECYEHQLVVDAVRNRLSPLTRDLQVSETDVYRLSNIQHLYTPMQGTLKADDGILPVVATLHPTPALGGSPRHLAMDVIRQSEPVPRGWYAAPVGWIDHEMNGQFAVAIRSAISQEKRVWLYAGAGIVADSVPQKEWDETALKFRPMLDALGIRALKE